MSKAILIDATGLTLYYRPADTPTSAKCSAACAVPWPPLLIPSGTPTGSPSGTGFELPLLPVAVAVSIAVVGRVRSNAVRFLFSVLFIAVSLFNFASKTDVVQSISQPVNISLAAFPSWPLADGRGNIQRYVSYSYPSPADATRLSAQEAGWLPMNQQVVASVIRYAATYGLEPVLFMGSSDPLFNTNTLGLACQYGLGHLPIPIGQLDPAIGGDSEAAYREQMSDPLRGQPNFLVTEDTPPYEFPPAVTRDRAEAAARALGFQLVQRFQLPDGRTAYIWWLDR